MIQKLGNITRIVVVDDTGRRYEAWHVNVSTDVQDDGRTLKLFVEPRAHWAGSPKLRQRRRVS